MVFITHDLRVAAKVCDRLAVMRYGEIVETGATGKIFKNPQLAETLEIIAEKGRDGFYEGHIANTMADFIQSQGGFLTYEDLSSSKESYFSDMINKQVL